MRGATQQPGPSEDCSDYTYRDYTYRDYTYRDYTYRDYTYRDYTYRDYTYRDYTYRDYTYRDLLGLGRSQGGRYNPAGCAARPRRKVSRGVICRFSQMMLSGWVAKCAVSLSVESSPPSENLPSVSCCSQLACALSWRSAWLQACAARCSAVRGESSERRKQ